MGIWRLHTSQFRNNIFGCDENIECAFFGALIWIIRLEGAVKANSKEIKRLGAIEVQAHDQEIRIKQRDEEMRAIKYSLDELKVRVTKVENNQVSTGETLVRIETKLDIMLKQKDAN